MIRSRLAVFFVVLGGIGPVAADEPGKLADGCRLRIQAPATGREGFLTGTLVAQDPGRLTMVVGDERIVVDRGQVSRLETSAGRNRKKGAGIGALVGTAVAGGLVLAGASGVGCHESECFCSGSGCLTGLLILGVPAAALGATTGALVAPERWRSVPAGTPSPAARSLLSRSVGPVRLSVVRAVGRGPGVGFEAGLLF